MRVNKNKKNDQGATLTSEELEGVIKEFTKRHYRDPRGAKLGRRELTKAKVYQFSGDNLPDIFLERSKNRGPAKKSLFIHPLTPPDLFRFPLEEDNRRYIHSNLSPFPVIDGQSANAYKVKFHTLKELGEILDNLLEIGTDRYKIQEGSDKFKPLFSSKLNEKKKPSISDVPPDPSSDIETTVATEGGRKRVFTYKYERDPALRKQALEAFGYICSACGADFEALYGELGKGYIELHHIIPVCEGERENNYRNLVPLCPNCHRMIHRLYGQLSSNDYGKAVSILKGKLKR